MKLSLTQTVAHVVLSSVLTLLFASYLFAGELMGSMFVFIAIAFGTAWIGPRLESAICIGVLSTAEPWLLQRLLVRIVVYLLALAAVVFIIHSLVPVLLICPYGFFSAVQAVVWNALAIEYIKASPLQAYESKR